VTITELFAVVAAALELAFATPGADGTKWARWPGPPDATGLPAVWPEFSDTFTAGARATGGAVAVRVVAAIAPQISAAEYSRLFDAHDRLDAITTISPELVQTSRSAILGPVEIGGIEHTALLYTFTLDRPLPC